MADEDRVVQEAEVKGETSKEGEVQEGTEQETKEQPLTKEDVAEMLKTETEKITSHFQSVKDREVKKFAQEAASQRRRAENAEAGMEATKTAFKDMSPENQQALELAELRARTKNQESYEVQERTRQEALKAIDDFEGGLSDYITGLGIDPTDKRIDWGDRESMNLTERQRIILNSVGKVQQEETKGWQKKMEQTLEDKFTQLRKDKGWDSADTTTSSSVSKGIPTDMVKFEEWVSGLSQEEWKAKKKDIDEMMSKGLIK